MIKHPAILATAIVLFSGAALAQQQYDSLGSPTPAPNQSASPNATGPNVPMASDKSSPAVSGKVQTDGSGSTTGSAIRTTPPVNSGAKEPDNRGATAPTNNGVTPGGLTPD
jgi:hypothetical protein